MASIRRTMSPGARSSTAVNGETCTTASPLSKTSNSNHLQPGSLLSSCLNSIDYAFYRAQACLFSIFSQRSSRSLERSKSTRQSWTWRRSLLPFVVCFFLGAFAGLTSIASSNSSLNLFSQHQAFSFEVLRGVDRISFYSMPRNATSVRSNLSMNDSVTSGHHIVNDEMEDGILSDSLSNRSLGQNPNVSHHKLLIIVTPTYARPFQAYHLSRLAHTLKLVPPPLLWIVVEMTSQSIETADLLRNAGIMYRHLVCSKNLTDRNDRRMHMLNVALAHIEIHHLDGINYFADDDNIYAPELFAQMRQISRFGTWTMGKYVETKSDVILDGPVCNGSQVIGWHKNNVTQKLCRFHADMGGFAFNSTILWDPKRWHRPTLESVRLLDTVKGGCYVSSFIEQIVEDESQMEGFPSNCSRVMVWCHHLVQLKIYALQRSAEIGSLQNVQAA